MFAYDSPKIRVLIADDDQDAADALGMLLECVGCETCVSHEGASALAAARCFSPHVAVFDLHWPNMGAAATARALRESLDVVAPLLIGLTDWELNDRRLDAYKGLFDAFLVKRLSLGRLKSLVGYVRTRQALRIDGVDIRANHHSTRKTSFAGGNG